jgi:DNA-binding FadR family transcriptional regulator
MLELRRGLVSEAVALAATRHTPADLEIMHRLGAEQADRVDDALAFARGDLAFQRAVVRAAKNVGLELVLNTFARFPDEQPGLVAALYDRREQSVAFYGAVIELVRAKNPEAARETMRAALLALDEEWNQRNAPKGAVSPRTADSPSVLSLASDRRKSGGGTTKGSPLGKNKKRKRGKS